MAHRAAPERRVGGAYEQSGVRVVTLSHDHRKCRENEERTRALEAAWRLCHDLFQCTRASPAADPEGELLFCLLGGFGVSFEHNRSAADLVGQLEPFRPERSDLELRQLLECTLSAPLFEPRRRDGSLRRYRYGRQKVEAIVRARAWLMSHRPLEQTLRRLPSGRERRAFLCLCPGVGLKTASWLLRNVGLGDDLAIVDIHLLRALRAAGRVGEIRLPRDYQIAESAFLGWCGDLDASPPAFDFFVWAWQRGTLQRSS